jgi:hypothetical protein
MMVIYVPPKAQHMLLYAQGYTNKLVSQMFYCKMAALVSLALSMGKLCSPTSGKADMPGQARQGVLSDKNVTRPEVQSSIALDPLTTPLPDPKKRLV